MESEEKALLQQIAANTAQIAVNTALPGKVRQVLEMACIVATIGGILTVIDIVFQWIGRGLWHS
jgi:hypothetical protein